MTTPPSPITVMCDFIQNGEVTTHRHGNFPDVKKAWKSIIEHEEYLFKLNITKSKRRYHFYEAVWTEIDAKL